MKKKEQDAYHTPRQKVIHNPILTSLFLSIPQLPRVGGRRVIVVVLCLCVCAFVLPSVHPSFRLSFVYLDNHGFETWICYEVGGVDGKIRHEAERPGEAGETDGCHGEYALIRNHGRWNGFFLHSVNEAGGRK